MTKLEHWISTDEAEDVAGSVRHAVFCLSATKKDAQAWKWVLLALHSSLQGACVCHLVTTTGPIGAVTPTNAAEWLAYFDDLRSNPKACPPKTRLLSLPELLKAARKPHSAGDRSNEHGISISDSELQWLTRLHDQIRNQFVHFEPMGWSIEVSGIPSFAESVSRIVSDILDAGWAFRHKDSTWRESLKGDLSRLKS